MKNKINQSKNVIIGNLENIKNIQVGDNITKIYQILGLNHDSIETSKLWNKIENSRLYKELERRVSKDKKINTLLVIVRIIYTYTEIFNGFEHGKEEGQDLTIKVIQLFDIVLPNEVIRSLNEIELSFLLLSAYLQNVGFFLTKQERKDLTESKEYKDFREDNIDFFLDIDQSHFEKKPNELKLIYRFWEKKFLAKQHVNRTSFFIRNKLQNLLVYNGSSYFEELIMVATSLNIDSWEFGFRKQIGRTNIDTYRRDKIIGGKNCNLQFLSICMKVSNLLAFNEIIHPTYFLNYFRTGSNQDVSFSDWKAHLNIDYWYISGRDLIYECVCNHPVYQSYLLELMEQIEQEIDKCTFLLSDNTDEIVDNYKIGIPRKINRDYIQSSDFIYGPIQFELDYNRIISLLMGERLYGKKTIVVRELLQNSIDACRHRVAKDALTNRPTEEYNPQININLETEGKKYILKIVDNGIGMDLDIVQNHLINIGSSYYQSKKFEKLRIEYKSCGVDFDPVSKFGIGILSCFMIADRIEIETFNGDTKESVPLNIKIEGSDKYFVIKETTNFKQGTTIKLFLSDRTIQDEDTIFDNYNIFTKLELLVKRYATHTIIPIRVNQNFLVRDKKYNFSDFIEHTRTIFKRFFISSAEKDFSNFLKVCEFELNDFGDNKFETEGMLGSSFFFFLLDSEGKFTYSSSTYSLISENNSSFSNFTLIETDSIKEAIKFVFEQYLDNEIKNELVKWLNEVYGIDSINKFSSFSLYTMMKLLFRRDTIHNFPKKLEKKFSEITSVFDSKLEKRTASYLSLMGQSATYNDGILINDGHLYNSRDIYCYGFLGAFLINFTKSSKPNITASRNSIIKDKALKNRITEMVRFLSKRFIEELKQGSITEQEIEKCEIFDKLAVDIRPSRRNILDFLLDDQWFTLNHFKFLVLINGCEKFVSISEVINEFDGELYLPEYHFIPNKLNLYIGRNRGVVKSIIARCKKIEFHTSKNVKDNYFKAVFDLPTFISPGKRDFNCEYKGIYDEKLFISNQLRSLNSMHPFGKIIEDFRDEKYHRVLMRIDGKIVMGYDEFKNDRDVFIRDLNRNLLHLKNILDRNDFSNALENIKFVDSELFYFKVGEE